MEERDHPWFNRRITTLMITVAIGGGAIIANLLGYLGPVLLTRTNGIVFTAVLVAGSIGYGFWAGGHVDCPRCRSRCEVLGGDKGKSRKVVCRKCEIIWDLGVTYSLKDE